MSEEQQRTEEQIRLLEQPIDGINEPVLLLNQMWNVIENFGIKRKLLDPHNVLDYNTIHNLYLTIKNRSHQDLSDHA